MSTQTYESLKTERDNLRIEVISLRREVQSSESAFIGLRSRSEERVRKANEALQKQQSVAAEYKTRHGQCMIALSECQLQIAAIQQAMQDLRTLINVTWLVGPTFYGDDFDDTQCLILWGLERQYNDRGMWVHVDPPTLYGKEVLGVDDTDDLRKYAVRTATKDPQFRARRDKKATWHEWYGARDIPNTEFCYDARQIPLRWNDRERVSLFVAVFYPKNK